jgi:hypothetical protein
MDAKNSFYTRTTYRLVRLDYLVIMAVLIALALRHLDQIRPAVAVAAFAMIDVVGYLPGAIWYYTRPPGRRSIPCIFHILYNTTHSVGANAIGAGVWYLLEGGFEWAMLALPIHLCGDRGVFGNVYKPFGLSFEPVPHPAFERFTSDFREAGRW